MRLAILSDVHANLEALTAALQAVEAEAVDRIVCLGDIVGYNANPAECIDLLRRSGAFCVAGNHDRGVTGQLPLSVFPRIAANAIRWTRHRLAPDTLDFLAGLPLELHVQGCLVAVHGALHPAPMRETVYLDREERRRQTVLALASHASGAAVCAFGHTHRVAIYGWRDGRETASEAEDVVLATDALWLINPGTIGEPRSAEQRATFMVLDTATRRLAVRRVPYDADAARTKSRDAGLLSLSSGRVASLRSALRRAAAAIGA